MTTALFAALVLSPATTVSVRVDGDGYLRFVRDARVVYAREAKLSVQSGLLCQDTGLPLLPNIRIADPSAPIVIGPDGTVKVSGAVAGRLVLGLFPEGTPSREDNGMKVFEVKASIGYPGDDLNGVIATVSGSNSAVLSEVKRPDPEKTIPVTKPPAEKPPVEKTPVEKPPVTAAGFTLTLKDAVQLKNDAVTVGDVVSVSGTHPKLAEILSAPLDRTPVIGVGRVIDQTRVANAIRQIVRSNDGWKLSGGSKVTVKRESQFVPFDQLVASAEAGLREILGATPILECNSPKLDFEAPVGTTEIRVKTASSQAGRAQVTVEIFVNGTKFNSRTLNFTVTGAIRKPAVGSMVQIIAVSGGVRIETTGRIVSVSATDNLVQVETNDKVRMAGKLVRDGVVEVTL